MADKVPMGNIVEVNPPAQPGAEGNRNPDTGANDQAVKKLFESIVLSGDLEGNEGLNGSGFGFSRFNRDYHAAPNIPDVTTDNDGREVVSPYAPNVASPNEDGEQEDLVEPLKGAGGAFRGDDLEKPKTSSERISRAGRLTLGSFGLGTSAPQSNGNAG